MDDCYMCDEVTKPASAVPMFIADLEASRVILNPNQFFKGRTVVIAKQHATELFQLTAKARRQFVEEMTYVASVLDQTFKPDKMNYALLGNVVPHLHWHLIPRYTDDPDWGAPIDYKQRQTLSDDEYAQRIKLIQNHL